MNITKEQWGEMLEGVLSFNRLVTTEQERNTEAYVLKCFSLTDDEIEEYLEAEAGSEEELKECADILVTAIQSLDAITPSLLKWEYIEERIKCVVEDNDTRIVGHSISNIIAIAIVDAEEAGYDLYGALMEVNRSNMSKVVSYNGYSTMHTHAWKEEAKRIEVESEGRYKDVTYSFVGAHQIVFRDSANKVLKPSLYKEPILTPYMNRGE